jgi:hypothetical protein
MNATMTNMTVCLNTTKTNVLNLLAHKGAPTVKQCNIIKTTEQIFQKSRSHPILLDTKRVMWVMFHTEDPKIQGDAGWKVNILEGDRISHSIKKMLI